MVRTMVQLSQMQSVKLKERARKEGVSLSELVRRGVDIVLDLQPASEEVRRNAKLTVAMFRSESGETDVSENHDKYLAEIYANDHCTR